MTIAIWKSLNAEFIICEKEERKMSNFRAENITWVSEPTKEEKKYFEKFHSWPQHMTWQAVISYENTVTHKADTMKILMDKQEYGVYLAELAILEFVRQADIKDVDTLLGLIVSYGRRCEDRGYENGYDNSEEESD